MIVWFGSRQIHTTYFYVLDYLTIWKVYSKQLLVSCLLFYCLFVCVVGMCLLPNQTIDFVCSQISTFFNPFPNSAFIVNILYLGPLGTKRACWPLLLSLMDMILGPHKKNWAEKLKSVQINPILRVSNILTHPVFVKINICWDKFTIYDRLEPFIRPIT